MPDVYERPSGVPREAVTAAVEALREMAGNLDIFDVNDPDIRQHVEIALAYANKGFSPSRKSIGHVVAALNQFEGARRSVQQRLREIADTLERTSVR